MLFEITTSSLVPISHSQLKEQHKQEMSDPSTPPQGSIRQDNTDDAVSNTSSQKAVDIVARRGPWLPEEDNRLLDLILLFGASNWVRISQVLGTRTPKQCRERYHQNLKPSLNRTPITQEEGELIEHLVATCGKKWAEIARHLNGRSDNAVKNWWNGGANRRRRASAQLDLDIVPQQQQQMMVDDENHDNSYVAFNTKIFTQDQQQQLQLMKFSQTSVPPPTRPPPPRRAVSFDFKYPQQQQQQQQPPLQQQQQQPLQPEHYHLSSIPRKQRKLIDEPHSRRHSAAYMGTSSPLSHPPSVSSRNSSLSHEFTGLNSYNSSDNESVSRRSSLLISNTNTEFYQQHRKNLSQHSMVHLSPSFPPQQQSRLSISSQLSTNINLPPLSPTFPNSRQNSIPSDRLPPLALPVNNNFNIPSMNIPPINFNNNNNNEITNNTNNTYNNNLNNTPRMNTNFFKREFSFSKLDQQNKFESPYPSPSLPQTLHHPLQQEHLLDDSPSGPTTAVATADDDANDNSDDVKKAKEEDDKRRMSIANLLG